MSSIQAETPIEQVECDDILGSIESVTATAVKDVETQFEQKVKPVKESDSIDGDSVSLLKRDFSQMLNNCESDMEKYPPAMEITLDSTTTASTEKVDMATDFASVNDDSVLMLAVVNDFGANPETTNDNLDVVAQEPVNYVNDNQDIPVHVVSQPALTTPDNLTPDSDAKEIADKDPTVEHHNVARKIQVQYRCFVRRRIILDQLRFILTKQRRKARKSRHKVKKANAFDNNTRGEKESAVVHVTMDATSMDNVQEEVQQVASTPMSSEIGFEVASTARSGEAPEPSEQTMKLGARKGSCEYVFDLFDTQEEAKGEEMQEAIVSVVNSAVEDKLSMTSVSDGDKNEPNLKKLDDQQHDDFAALPEKDVMIASTDATKCLEVLPVEEDIVFEGPVLLPSKATQDEVHSSISTARADAGGLVTSMMLTELAFTTVEQEPRVPADTIRVEDGAPQMQQHWERYVDSTTNKSFYYNPSTNETQWTAPTEDRDYAAINSSRVTPTTPRTTVVTATDAVSPSGHFLSAHETTGTWQEFLDEATGHLYYYNTKTGECSWEPPASRSDPSLVVESLQSVATAESTAIGASPWVMYIDPASQVPYYVNTETLATSWEQPQAFAVAAQPTEDKYVIAIDDHAALQI
ncbi:Hypothetical protein PHPALM_20869 [Phytophthora palmivora]|uniref:WW domain-containing protein n=1 Tax=Phytophthora palmivora TaxID=4796 RepID=A0A2P4XDS1_9STRA|nr:Hypothetical protein PHPALM_20869 [Phytophthora palmivora]